METEFAIAAIASELPAGESPPEWALLFPAGRTTPRDNRPSWEIRDADAVVAASAAEGRELPIDYDHATDLGAPHGRPAPAAGWITKLENRAGAVWARIRWTESGGRAVTQREYRYLSPAFRHSRKTGVVSQILRAALVNEPALPTPSLASRQPQAGATHGDTMDKELLAALGLAEDADTAAAVAAVKALGGGAALAAIAKAAGLDGTADATAIAARVTELAAARPDPTQYVPKVALDELSATVATLQATAAQKEADAAVGDAIKAGKVSPGMKDWATAYAAKDLSGFREWAKATPAIVTPGASDAATGDPPGTADVLTDDAKAVAARLGIAEDQMLASQQQLAKGVRS